MRLPTYVRFELFEPHAFYHVWVIKCRRSHLTGKSVAFHQKTDKLVIFIFLNSQMYGFKTQVSLVYHY